VAFEIIVYKNEGKSINKLQMDIELKQIKVKEKGKVFPSTGLGGP
jgi:hypothetical protein